MDPERRVKLLRIDRRQVVRIPKEFQLLGDRAIVRKEGDRIIIEPWPREEPSGASNA